MIRLIQWGNYRLAMIAEGNAFISIDDDAYSLYPDYKTLELSDADIDAALTLHHGDYRLYDVYDEPQLAETIHLELEDEDGYIKSYLLPRGLPENSKRRVRQLTTAQQITHSAHEIIIVKMIKRGNL